MGVVIPSKDCFKTWSEDSDPDDEIKRPPRQTTSK